VGRLFSSVRVRITFAVALIFGLTLSLASVLLVRQVEAALLNDIQYRNDAVASAISEMMAQGQFSAEDLAAADSLNEELVGSELGDSITQSYVFATGPAVGAIGQGGSMLDRLRRTIMGEATPLFGKSLPGNLSPELYATSQVAIPTASGTLVVNVARPLDDVARTVNKITNSLAVAVPVFVVLIGGMTWFMTGRALRPVSAITNRVQEITASTLQQRVPEPETEDEIGDLARTMNEMLDRLEDSSARQKQFLSDASHELRSPVASIRAQLETGLIDPAATDWEEVARTVLAEDDRLDALVSNLVALARLEEGAKRPLPTEVDLDEIVREVTARVVPMPIDRSGVLAGRVMGVSGELTSVVRNLVDNAVRHADDTVKVSLDTYGPIVRLSVEDDGEGIAPVDRDRVFERFTRLETGRSRDRGGSGIGLALVSRVVDAHRGKVFVESSELGGAAFVVELPSAE
jgi:signal transduction histidine kinase